MVTTDKFVSSTNLVVYIVPYRLPAGKQGLGNTPHPCYTGSRCKTRKGRSTRLPVCGTQRPATGRSEIKQGGGWGLALLALRGL